MFAICMQGLLLTIDEKVPKWTLTQSRIGDNPGLGFRPMPIISQGSLVWISERNITTIAKYIETIDEFLMRELTIICGIVVDMCYKNVFSSLQNDECQPTSKLC